MYMILMYNLVSNYVDMFFCGFVFCDMHFVIFFMINIMHNMIILHGVSMKRL